MRTQEATAFEQEFIQGKKGLQAHTVLKPKRNRFIGGGQGSNIRPAIPGGVTMTTINPRDNAKAWTKAENRETWKAKRTYMGYQHGWVLLEDDSEDSIPDDPERTHILGGVVDHGTHTTGVCSDECWCKEGEEE